MNIITRINNWLAQFRHVESMEVVPMSPEPPELIKIDLSAKYALLCNRQMSREDVEFLLYSWEKFFNDPDQHIVILQNDMKLVKIDEAAREKVEAG